MIFLTQGLRERKSLIWVVMESLEDSGLEFCEVEGQGRELVPYLLRHSDVREFPFEPRKDALHRNVVRDLPIVIEQLMPLGELHAEGTAELRDDVSMDIPVIEQDFLMPVD